MLYLPLLQAVTSKQTFLKFSSPFCRYQYCETMVSLERDFGGIQDIVVTAFQTKIWMLSPVTTPSKVVEMPNLGPNGLRESRNHEADSVDRNLASDEDLLMEQILENINSTSIGQVLKKIASLPEARREKVLDLRRQLTEGKYNLNERLDIALDKFLEDLTS